MKHLLLSLSFLVLSAGSVLSQDAVPLPYAENMIGKLLAEIRTAPGDTALLAANDLLVDALSRVLTRKEAFSYPFDSLKGITSVTSPDRKFRLFTWPVRLATGRYLYSGILQVPDKKSGTVAVTVLRDAADSLPSPGTALLRGPEWYGQVCYQVIPVKTARGTAYTLLGWRGIDLLVSTRLIDILSFATDGSVTFGRAVFCDKDPMPDTRIIFRYSAGASMVLTYEKQAVVTGKSWNAKKREFEVQRIREMMIVCDRIQPMDPNMEGRYEYYIPASDIMDGFAFSGGCWKKVTGVDARNPYQKPKPLPKTPAR